MKPNTMSWRLDRRINLSVLVQLMVLASLIVGSWLNLQRWVSPRVIKETFLPPRDFRYPYMQEA